MEVSGQTKPGVAAGASDMTFLHHVRLGDGRSARLALPTRTRVRLSLDGRHRGGRDGSGRREGPLYQPRPGRRGRRRRQRTVRAEFQVEDRPTWALGHGHACWAVAECDPHMVGVDTELKPCCNSNEEPERRLAAAALDLRRASQAGACGARPRPPP